MDSKTLLDFSVNVGIRFRVIFVVNEEKIKDRLVDVVAIANNKNFYHNKVVDAKIRVAMMVGIENETRLGSVRAAV